MPAAPLKNHTLPSPTHHHRSPRSTKKDGPIGPSISVPYPQQDAENLPRPLRRRGVGVLLPFIKPSVPYLPSFGGAGGGFLSPLIKPSVPYLPFFGGAGGGSPSPLIKPVAHILPSFGGAGGGSPSPLIKLVDLILPLLRRGQGEVFISSSPPLSSQYFPLRGIAAACLFVSFRRVRRS